MLSVLERDALPLTATITLERVTGNLPYNMAQTNHKQPEISHRPRYKFAELVKTL